MFRAIQYRRFGGPAVLEMNDVPEAPLGPGQVRVAVHAAGLNPIDAKTFAGGPLRVLEAVNRLRHPGDWFGRETPRFPRTVGRDFAGVVDATGPGVSEYAVGDPVLGTLRSAPGQGDVRGSLAERLVARLDEVASKPPQLSDGVAASLGVAGMTACGALRALTTTRGDVLAISGASGSVGSMATQLAVHRGVTVLGIAGQANADYLRSLGAIPVTYGPDLADRLRAAAPAPITAFLDCYGGDYPKTALAMGVPARRFGTLVPNPRAMVKGVRFTGSRHAQPHDLVEVAALVADATIRVDVHHVYPFDVDAVRDGYAQLAAGHVRGKLVVAVG